MTPAERAQLEQDYKLYLFLLDYYAKNRDAVISMNDQEYRDYLDEILDELNRIKILLKKQQ